MQKYKVINRPLSLFTGRVDLTSDQAKKRSRSLKKGKKDGVYQVISPIQFKVGEIIGLRSVPKSILSGLEVLEKSVDLKNPNNG